MHGVVFCLFKKMVVVRLGAEAWDTLVERTPLTTAGGLFVGTSTYPDADLLGLVGTASEVTGRPVGELLRAFARFSFPDLAAVNPAFIGPETTARSFLASVDAVIHSEVHKQQPMANLPYFTYEDAGPDRLVMLYHSPRNLCDLVSGFIDGVGDYFGDEIVHEHLQCKRDGHPHCRFELQFVPGTD